MPARLDPILSAKLEQQASKGILRQLPRNKGPLVDFASNDYLGLARSIELSDLIEKEYLSQGRINGSTGSRLLTGNDDYTETVEAELAATFQSETALIFSSGYSANTAVLSSIPGKGDTIIYDEFSHASIKDGARLSFAKRFSFAHNAVDDLERKIRIASGRVYVVVESIYSMDGDICPLREIVELTKEKGAFLILDEAHSTGVTGIGGSGMAVDLGLADDIPIRIYTFGKAMGVHGACVAGSTSTRDYLINFARPFIYTTAPDRHTVGSIRWAFRVLQHRPVLQQSLTENIDVFLDQTRKFANRTHSPSAIQTLIIPGADQVRSAARDLHNNGMDVRPIVSPTVPKGTERLRICLHSYNTPEEIKMLASFLQVHARYE